MSLILQISYPGCYLIKTLKKKKKKITVCKITSSWYKLANNLNYLLVFPTVHIWRLRDRRGHPTVCLSCYMQVGTHPALTAQNMCTNTHTHTQTLMHSAVLHAVSSRLFLLLSLLNMPHSLPRLTQPLINLCVCFCVQMFSECCPVFGLNKGNLPAIRKY